VHRLNPLKTWYSILNGTYNPKSIPVENLDIFSRWLVATRSVVFVMTANSVLIASLLAWIAYGFRYEFILPILLTLIGLVLAHAASNLFNDYWDAKHGIDTSEGYFRPSYLPHPSVSGMMSQKTLFSLGTIHLVAMLIIASYVVSIRGPLVILFTLAGALFLILYAGGPLPLKKIGLGEIAVFLVWGPLMIGGSFFVITGKLPIWVLVASIPYGVSVSTVLFGKHIDKISYDTKLGIKTVPVILGEERTKDAIKVLISLAYASILVLVLVHLLPLPSLLSFLALPKAVQLFKFLSIPKPEKPPEGYSLWPIWYLGSVFSHNRRFGFLLIVGLAISFVFPVYI
jgi:1,4-dihydroxy-2-naphthoate octaprenyltransferase